MAGVRPERQTSRIEIKPGCPGPRTGRRERIGSHRQKIGLGIVGGAQNLVKVRREAYSQLLWLRLSARGWRERGVEHTFDSLYKFVSSPVVSPYVLARIR
jgi:hypothetical protein